MSPFVVGVRDVLPLEIEERKWLYDQLREVFGGEGYQEVATPTLESYELYAGLETFMERERMFKVVDESGQILVLRPDLTMPIARLAAVRYSKVPAPWKFSYISTAYQTNGGQSHLMKEKTQAGIELLGRADLLADVEAIGVLIRALKKVGIRRPQIDIGQAALVEEIFAELPLESWQKREVRALMEKKNVDELKTLLNQWEIPQDCVYILTQFPGIFGQPENVLRDLQALSLTEKAQKIVLELQTIYQSLCAIGYGEYITFDPSMVTRLGYYTGTIFRAYVDGYGEVLASGGRYDGLLKRFGSDVAAVGFAIEIERLLACMKNGGAMVRGRVKSLVFHVSGSDDFPMLYRLGVLLRERGIQVELYMGENVQEYCRFHGSEIYASWGYAGDERGNMRFFFLDGRFFCVKGNPEKPLEFVEQCLELLRAS